MPDLEDRFWDKVKIGDGCWEWTASRKRKGYGRIAVGGGVARQANQVAWELWHGKSLPHGMCALHTCDHPWCVRPSHIFIGTRVDNIADMDAKGRRGVASGAAHPSKKYPELYREVGRKTARLSLADLAEIRRLYASGGYSQKELAVRFGVVQPHISRVIRGEVG